MWINKRMLSCVRLQITLKQRRFPGSSARAFPVRCDSDTSHIEKDKRSFYYFIVPLLLSILVMYPIHVFRISSVGKQIHLGNKAQCFYEMLFFPLQNALSL